MDGPSAQFDVRFIADNATSMTLQSDKTNLIAEESVTLKAVFETPGVIGSKTPRWYSM
jgi:hypothetical protein